MNGTEILLRQIMKSAGLNPDEVLATVSTMGAAVIEAKKQLDRIEEKQDRILLMLAQEPEEIYPLIGDMTNGD